MAKYWAFARGVLDLIDPTLLTAFSPSIAGFLSELETEDRAILSRWERVRVAVLADYDAQVPARAYRRLARFVANDLPDYRVIVRPRLAAPGNSATRRAALRTLHHLVRATALLLGPIVPHTAEAVHSAATSGGTSLFEATVEPLDANLLDDDRSKAWDRWRSVLAALDRFRSSSGLPLGTPLPSVVAVVATDDLAQALRGDRPIIERLGRVTRFEAFGPSTPWTGRRRDLEPVLSEIQKVYRNEARQIEHLLMRLPARRRIEPGSTEELNVVVQGIPRRILPSMVAYVERIPERVVPVAWNQGELYVEMPAPQPVPTRVPPPLSTDGFGLVRRVERLLRQHAVAPGTPRPPIVIATLDPLAAELRNVSTRLAEYLNVAEVRVLDDYREFPLVECEHGRSRTGVPWWVHIQGVVPRRRPAKHRAPLLNRSRVRPTRPISPTREPERDFAAPEWIDREEQIRALMQELDAVLGSPLLGFAKVAGAWDAGLQSRSAYEAVAFDTLAALPGFGWTVAEALVQKLGRTPPPRPVRQAVALPPPPMIPLTETSLEPAVPPPYLEPRAPPPPGPVSRNPAAPARPRELPLTRVAPSLPATVPLPMPVPLPAVPAEPVAPPPPALAPSPPPSSLTPEPAAPPATPPELSPEVEPEPAVPIGPEVPPEPVVPAEPDADLEGPSLIPLPPGDQPSQSYENAADTILAPPDEGPSLSVEPPAPSSGAPPPLQELERQPFAIDAEVPMPPAEVEGANASAHLLPVEETSEIPTAPKAPVEDGGPRGMEVAPPLLGEELSPVVPPEAPPFPAPPEPAPPNRNPNFRSLQYPRHPSKPRRNRALPTHLRSSPSSSPPPSRSRPRSPQPSKWHPLFRRCRRSRPRPKRSVHPRQRSSRSPRRREVPAPRKPPPRRKSPRISQSRRPRRRSPSNRSRRRPARPRPRSLRTKRRSRPRSSPLWRSSTPHRCYLNLRWNHHRLRHRSNPWSRPPRLRPP